MTPDKLVTRLDQVNQNFDEKHALLVADTRHVLFGAQVDQPFPAASLIKLGIAAFVKEKAADDPSQLERQVTLPESVGGAGILRFMSPQAWRVRDLLTLMLTVSDNLATNALLTTYGLPTIAAWLTRHYPGVQLRRPLMQSTFDGDNMITASAAWQLLRALLMSDGNEPAADICAQALRHQQNRIKLLLAPTMENFVGWLAGKTGELPHCEHDAACFAAEGERLYAVVLTQFDYDRQTAMQFGQQVGHLIVQAFQEKRDRFL